MNNKTVIGIVVTLVAICLIYLGVTIYFSQKASNKVLENFVTVNENLERTNKQFEKASNKLEQQFINALLKNKNQKVCDLYTQSLNKLDSLQDLIKSTKDTLIILTEGNKDYMINSEYMIEGGNAEKLKFAIQGLIFTHNEIRKQLSLPAKYIDYVAPVKDEDGMELSWETYNFFHLPLAGVITNLSFLESEMDKIQLELKEEITTYSSKLK